MYEDMINHIHYLAMQDLSWEEALQDLRELYYLSHTTVEEAHRVFLNTAQRAVA